MSKFIFFFLLFFSSYAVATSDMVGVTKYGYFDNSDIESKITCGDDISESGSYAPTYECELSTSTVKVKWLVSDNNDCSSYSLYYRKMGEFNVECGIYGQNITSFYRYDNVLNNWFLYKSITQYGAMDGPDVPAPDDKVIMPNEQWSIDKTLLKIVGVHDPLRLINIIENKYKKKKYNVVLAFAKANNLDMSQLSTKTVTQYNNMAFYYQQSGANAQAVPVLSTIIQQFPDREVAYLNLGDAYISLKEPSNALTNYQKYVSIMTDKGKADKIPKRVKDFLSSSN